LKRLGFRPRSLAFLATIATIGAKRFILLEKHPPRKKPAQASRPNGGARARGIDLQQVEQGSRHSGPGEIEPFDGCHIDNPLAPRDSTSIFNSREMRVLSDI
jgi:hypothetical protein